MKILAHEHTGKLRPHAHTSYGGLLVTLLLAGSVLVMTSWSAMAAPPAVNPQSGSVGLTGRMNGPAPTMGATILVPTNGTHIKNIPVTVSGVCPVGTFVSVERNNVFGGVTQCQDAGTFSLLIDLFDGANTLIAKVSDALGQYGPDSPAVHVFYDGPSFNLPSGSVGQQLILETDTTVMGGSPGVDVSRKVTIVGGVGPYAINFDYGDGQTWLSSQAAEGSVTGKHSYARPGTYVVIVHVTDAAGNSAYLQLITIINGPVVALGTTHGEGLAGLSGVLIAAWPLFILATLLVIAFFIGERVELRKIRRQQLTTEGA